MTLRSLLGLRRMPVYWVPWIGAWSDDRITLILRGGPDGFVVRQYDWSGKPMKIITGIGEGTETVALDHRLGPGIATTEGVDTDVVVAMTTSTSYTATHGRGEFIESCPRIVRWIRRLVRPVERVLWIHPGMRLFIVNLSRAYNRIQVGKEWWGLFPLGSVVIAPPTGRLRLRSGTWFGVYTVGTGADGSLALQHVK